MNPDTRESTGLRWFVEFTAMLIPLAVSCLICAGLIAAIGVITLLRRITTPTNPQPRQETYYGNH